MPQLVQVPLLCGQQASCVCGQALPPCCHLLTGACCSHAMNVAVPPAHHAQVLTTYKYKVKLIPGTLKKGKAVRQVGQALARMLPCVLQILPASAPLKL